MAHSAFGVTGCMAALWAFVEVLNARPENVRRIRVAAMVTAICMVGAWICGGYWYVHFYPSEKTIILKGRWPFAHNLFMETKEHLFFVTGILAFLLPIIVRERLYSSASAQRLVLATSALVVITGLAMEGAEAVTNHGVKVALLSETAAGGHQ